MTVAIVAFSNIATDARVLRQIEYLSKEYDLRVIGYGSLPEMENVRMFPVDRPDVPVSLSPLRKIFRRLRNRQIAPYIQLILGRLLPSWAYETWYWSHPEYRQAHQYILDINPTFIHANDWTSLPAAVRAARILGVKVIADLHEYAPLELNGILWHLFLRPLREFVLRRYIPGTAATITVNKTIADKYQQVFGFSPIVVMNTPMLNNDIAFRPTRPDCIQLIHHGGLAKGRNPELMIETASHLEDRYYLYFMLIGNQSEITRLQNLAKSIAPVKVSFLPPVPPSQVTQKISQFDIGFYLLPTQNFNNSVASPNKFFDFIHAGLAVCIGPSPEMSRLCDEFGFGVVSPSFSPTEVAKLLNQLQPDEIDRMKQAAINARHVLNADVEMGKLVDIYHQLSRDVM